MSRPSVQRVNVAGAGLAANRPATVEAVLMLVTGRGGKPGNALNLPKQGRYEFPDQTAGGIPYVGQSGNIPNRLNQHENAGRYDPGTVSIVEVQGGKTSRDISETRQVGRQGDELAQAVSANSVRSGEFSITNWANYPAGVPKPTSPVNLITGAEYEPNRAAANSANRAIHQADPSISPQQIHEIQPVKFGGSPANPANKMAVEPSLHYQLNTWWKDLQRYIEGINGR